MIDSLIALLLLPFKSVRYDFQYCLSALKIGGQHLNVSFYSCKWIYPFKNFVLNFSSRNWAKEFDISLSHLETGERNSSFSFSSRNWAKEIWTSLSTLETRQRDSNFSFSSQNWWKGIQISLSPLEMGEILFEFLFLFSIGLFCLSSMTGRQHHRLLSEIFN